MKVVTVGTSNICELLISGFKEVGIEVFACVGRNNEKTKEFALKNDVKYHASDYDAVLNSDVFDTVYLAIPNSLHYEYAKKALLKNKNVICEKPLASNFKEAKELVSLANDHKVFLFDALTSVHNLAYKQLKDDLKLLGKIHTVDVSLSRYSSKFDAFLNGLPSSTLNPKMSGGALMDMGVYNIAFVLGLFGLPKAVKYFANMQNGVDISGISILQYDEFLVSSTSGKDANGGSSFTIRGEKGYIDCRQASNNFNEYTVFLNDGTLRGRSFVLKSRYFDELNDFKSMFEYKNIRKNNEYLTLSLMYMKVLDELRNSAGIIFEADK